MSQNEERPPPARRRPFDDSTLGDGRQTERTAVRVLPGRTPSERGFDAHFRLYRERWNRLTPDEQFVEHAEAIAQLERTVAEIQRRFDDLAAFVGDADAAS